MRDDLSFDEPLRDSGQWGGRLHAAVLQHSARRNMPPDELAEMVVALLQDGAADRAVSHAELRHRMKNEMQILAAAMRQRQREAKADVMASACALCIGQVSALGQLHEALDGAPRGDRVDLARQCHRLAEAMRNAFRLGDADRFDIRAAPLLVPHGTVRNVVLILNEMLVNAIKHGGGGALRIALDQEAGGWATLMVENPRAGTGAAAGKGRGHSLVDALAGEIGARIHHAEDDAGFRVSCTFPLDRAATTAP
ncbi:histidine kinase dimerization/phosphoacceptor domain -containing protein [Roseibacterium sp. SDUM158017]|uniref:histidine kinase dimerization/phosphoacceptor domain -containing protein n=1 Tax=Roseicyclus salinarum TaxID=3036773 RepID=UPI0024158BDD|nr:histidine kinase dimerization/phosphoacceptor domain -containing protein [Roseibacterium sp. SDUM158017]MDG4650330.1 histidine kinase dimerization/phosphoacceptor domain -containing protein [Roseibacterium sp. SDUM158017]